MPLRDLKHLVPEHERTNPNRLNTGVTSVADQNENKIPVVERASPLKRNLKIGALILAILAGGLVSANAAGVPLPPLLVNIAKVLHEIGKQADQQLPADQ